MVNGDELCRRLHRELIGQRISFIRLACDMLLLYVECNPGDGQGLTIWFNPPWRVSAPDGVIADSRQVRGDNDGPTEAELDRISEPIYEKLINQPITEVQVDQCSRNLTVTVAVAYDAKTCASDLENDHLWHIRENATGLTLYATTTGWRVRVGKV